nr:alcohol dehydrogenase catalytic domain-containing protein [uncultured Oscillibacter sp.]
MKKLVLTDFHKVEVVEAPIPVPGRGQAVVRVKYAGICGSDLHVFSGLHPTAKPPLVMGHEACGELYAIDSGRTDVKVGDKVCVHTVEPCNACEGCCAGRENLCTSVKIMGTSLDGVFTQYMLVNADRVIRFGGGVDDKVAALVEPLTVGVHDLRRSGFRAGEDVFISGAGPIGLIIGIMARFSGAAHVVLSEIDRTRMEIARGMGFTVVDPGGADFEAVCAENCGGMGFDRVFEITSVQSSFDTCVSRLKRGGALVQVGMPPAGKIFDLDINKIIYSECDLLGVRHHTMSDMQAAVKIIDSGVLDAQLRPLVSAIYSLDKSMEAFERARTDKSVLRVLIDLTA